MSGGSAALNRHQKPALEFAKAGTLSARRVRVPASAALYLAMFAVLAVYSYWRIFSYWATFDDEGFFVYSLKTFLAGHQLYGSTYSEYGPFYYVVFGLFFKVTGIAVTEDAGRFLTLFCWLGASLCLGLTAHRFTRSIWIGLLTAVASYNLMATFPGGPMHAQIIVVLLTAGLGSGVLLCMPRFGRAGPLLIGALAAAIALTKINLGGYAFVAIAFALTLAGQRLPAHRWLRALATVLFLCLGLVLMKSELNVSVERNYALCYGLSAAGVAVAAWPRASRDDQGGLRRVWWILAGVVVCALLTIVVALVFGMSLSAWIQQTIITPTHQGKFLNGYLRVSYVQLGVGVLAVVMAAMTRTVVARTPGNNTVQAGISGVARLVIGLLIMASAATLFPFKTAPYPYEVAWPFVWIIVLAPKRAGRDQRLARVMLAALAISQSLMAYPVAGTQIPLGDMLFVLCGAVALGDAITELRVFAAGRTSLHGAALATAAVAVLAVVCFVNDAASQVKSARLTYSVFSSPINGIGAGRIRIAQPWDGGVNSVIRKLRQEHCQTLMELPGVYSFNLWSGLSTPSPLTGEQPYWAILSSGQQQQVLAAAQAAPGLCLIRSKIDVEFYIHDEPLPRGPLVNYLTGQVFERVGTYYEWSVWVRSGRRRE